MREKREQMFNEWRERLKETKGVEGEDGVERLVCLVLRVERGTRRYRERGVWAISNSGNWGSLDIGRLKRI